MPKRKTEKTLEEIITDAEQSVTKARKRRGVLIVVSLIIFLLLVLYGFVMARQRLLDLEAEAFIRAVQTATERARDMGDQPPDIAPPAETQLQQEPEAQPGAALDDTSTADLTATPEP